jgi:hypothetical protein
MADVETVSPLLTVAEAAQLVRASPRRLTDRAWRQRVGLCAIRVGGALRFDPSDVARWLEDRRESPRAVSTT